MGYCVMKGIGLTLATVALCSIGLAQQTRVFSDRGLAQHDAKSESAKANDQKAATKGLFTLIVKQKPILNITLKAEKARLDEVAESLSKQLRTPVFLSPSMERETISVEFSELTLEPAVQLMAPEVYIDYEINTGAALPPKPIGIFFYGANQAEPPVSAVVPGNMQSLLIEGDTEEGVEPTTDEQKKKLEEQPLRVTFQNNYLSVKARKQPLALVLLKIGDELGIPVDIANETDEVIDTEFQKLPVEDAIRHLSSNIRLYIRADLVRAERRALRLVLTGPERPKTAGL
jgi:hypothetical protein